MAPDDCRHSPTRRRLWLPWRRDVERHVGSFAVSIAFHVALLFIFATLTFTPGSGLLGWGETGLGEASIRLGEERMSDLDARALLKEITIDPVKVPERAREVPRLPELRSLATPRGGAERLKHISTRFTVPGGVGGLSGGFGSLIGHLRKSGLDVVLVIDSSGSTQHVIDDLKARMVSLVATVQRLVPTARVGAVAFRDRGEEYVVKWSDLTFHGKKVEAFLSQLRAEGGGDWEEAVKEALETAIHDLSWRRRSKKVIILVGSSPPHAADRAAILDLLGTFRRRGGIVSTIDITARLHEEFERRVHRSLYGTEPTTFSPLPDFYRQVTESYTEIARAGGGEIAGVGWDRELTEQILVFTFGSRWRAEVTSVTKR